MKAQIDAVNGGGELEDDATKMAHGETDGNPNASGPNDGNNGLDGVKHIEEGANQTAGGPGASRAVNPNDPFDVNFLIELPYHVEITHITKMTDVKSTWRKGIQAIQDMF